MCSWRVLFGPFFVRDQLSCACFDESGHEHAVCGDDAAEVGSSYHVAGPWLYFVIVVVG
jgi:hypothetical protein